MRPREGVECIVRYWAMSAAVAVIGVHRHVTVCVDGGIDLGDEGFGVGDLEEGVEVGDGRGDCCEELDEVVEIRRVGDHRGIRAGSASDMVVGAVLLSPSKVCVITRWESP